ncbi:MAG TPA: histidine kinase [Opitutaceae bacterium]|nr:histidine kinase [Opitutaceae bacterium]
MQSRWARIALLVGLWAFVGLVLSIEVYFNVRVSEPDVSFWEMALPQYQRAALWALLAPLVLWLWERIPLSRGRWVGGVTCHLAFSFAIMAGYYLVRIFYYMIRDRDPLADFWVVAGRSFFGRNIIDMVFYWAVIAFGYVGRLSKRYKQEEVKAAQLESQLIEAELKALKQQLHPHFLFNTMNTISVLVREGRNQEAVQLLARFSSLLRTLLDNTRVQEVTLRQEIDFLERYMEIQKMRFSDRLTFRVVVEPAAFEARIPNLILQPLVENAVLHGLAQKAGPGVVEVHGRVTAGRLHLEVRDDGPGFVAHGPGRVTEGIGLSNTRERLARTYGHQYQMVIESEKDHGVVVSLVLPYRS